MSILRNLESKLEGLFEGAFSKTFKSKVQPVEIARKLAKEMQDNKTVSISRTYVPNQYLVYLSEADRQQFEGYEDGVLKELSDYLLDRFGEALFWVGIIVLFLAAPPLVRAIFRLPSPTSRPRLVVICPATCWISSAGNGSWRPSPGRSPHRDRPTPRGTIRKPVWVTLRPARFCR